MDELDDEVIAGIENTMRRAITESLRPDTARATAYASRKLLREAVLGGESISGVIQALKSNEATESHRKALEYVIEGLTLRKLGV